jgi:hypothetical protein
MTSLKIHPLYPFGSIADLETLNKTIEHQGKSNLNYVEAQDMIINSYTELNGKPPKYLTAKLAVSYIQQFQIETPEIEPPVNYKQLLREFTRTVLENVSDVKETTDLGLTVNFRISGDKLDMYVLRGTTPVFGEQYSLNAF